MHHWISVVCGPKFTKFFSSNVEGAVIERVFLRFSICRSFPEIFAIKVESCQKSRQILDDFLPSQTSGAGPSKSYTHFITRAWKKFCEDTPTSPEVISAYTLNFKPNFKFSRLQFFGGPPSQFRCALARLGQSLARVKI